jgi:peptide/nickel transport system ATP-binding protein
MSDTILKVNGLKKYFKTKKKNKFVKAIDGIDFELKRGELLGLVGESGSGKSTTAYVIMGMYSPTDGKVFFNDKDISVITQKRSLSLKKEIQIVFQDPGTSLNPQSSIGNILSLPIKIHQKKSGKELRDKVIENLEKVELPAEYYNMHPREIGGGEKQLVALARALGSNPSFIVLDEPTSALDVSIQAKIIGTLKKIQEEMNLSYLFITHDLSLMRNIADRVAIMYLGKIVEIGPVETLFKNPDHPYTQMLISSIPVVTSEEDKIKPKQIESKGEIPSPVDIPPGCGFQTRCPFVMDRCKKEEPKIIDVSNEHKVKCFLLEK